MCHWEQNFNIFVKPKLLISGLTLSALHLRFPLFLLFLFFFPSTFLSFLLQGSRLFSLFCLSAHTLNIGVGYLYRG